MQWKPLETLERLFYLLHGEQIGKAGKKIEVIRRQLGEVMVAWTSVMGQRPAAYIEPRSVSLTVCATHPPTVSRALK